MLKTRLRVPAPLEVAHSVRMHANVPGSLASRCCSVVSQNLCVIRCGTDAVSCLLHDLRESALMLRNEKKKNRGMLVGKVFRVVQTSGGA